MVEEIAIEQMEDRPRRRGRGPTRPFPAIAFEDALRLPSSILEHGINGQIERITLLSMLEYSPSSSKTRDWITSSSKYGLTTGSYNAPYLAVTDDGRVAVSSSDSDKTVTEKRFDLAIRQFSHFDSTYERLKGQRLPDEAVLLGELRRTELSDSDSQKAAEVFAANLKFLGLVQEITGNDYVRDIEQLLDEYPTAVKDTDEADSIFSPSIDSPIESTQEQSIQQSVAAIPVTHSDINSPSLHIDIQIHIDSSASAEQIDQVFASMAKHLYGREG